MIQKLSSFIIVSYVGSFSCRFYTNYPTPFTHLKYLFFCVGAGTYCSCVTVSLCISLWCQNFFCERHRNPPEKDIPSSQSALKQNIRFHRSVVHHRNNIFVTNRFYELWTIWDNSFRNRVADDRDRNTPVC